MSITFLDSTKRVTLDFWDALKDSGKKFSKLNGGEKAITIALTILASLPTLGIAGVFTFMGCSDYFAKKHVENITRREGGIASLEGKITDASKPVFPLSQEAAVNNTIKNTFPFSFLPKFMPNDMRKQEELPVKTGGIAPKGIVNLGNSCYLNSTMQVLIHSDFFRNQIMNPTWPAIEKMKKEAFQLASGNNALLQDLHWAFAVWDNNPDNDQLAFLKGKYPPEVGNLFEDVYKRFSSVKRLQLYMQEFVRQYDSSKKPKDLKKFAENLRNALFANNFSDYFNLYGQQDAAELIGKIFNMIGIEIPSTMTRKIPNTTIEKIDRQPLSTIPITMYPGENVSAQEMVDLFSETHEEITPWRGYDYHQVTQRLGTKPPQELVLHFKRFGMGFFGSDKIHDPLKVPENHILDLTKAFNGESAHYRIRGAICHSGGLGGGHYWALMRKGDKWYEANDSKISPIKNINQELDEAYILFLEKV